jgi:hypothetical protein
LCVDGGSLKTLACPKNGGVILYTRYDFFIFSLVIVSKNKTKKAFFQDFAPLF